MHVLPLSNTSKAGIHICLWLEMLVAQLCEEGANVGCPAFCYKEGYMLTTVMLEFEMHPILEDLQKEPEFSELIPVGLEVRQWFFMARILQSGAENDALEKGNGENTIK